MDQRANRQTRLRANELIDKRAKKPAPVINVKYNYTGPIIITVR